MQSLAELSIIVPKLRYSGSCLQRKNGLQAMFPLLARSL